ncbi:MAG: SurA N-terminal domain-containing protein [Geminicoccaceae bacterium]
MLSFLRSNASSWVIKVFLGLLILSFAVWGIGDIFSGRLGGNAVATVGDVEIGADALVDTFSQDLRRVQAQTNNAITRQQAVQFGVLEGSLQALIARGLIDAEALELGVTVNDEEIRRQITANPAFREGGRFSRQRFEDALRQAGLGEAEYVANLRSEQTRQAFVESLANAPPVPSALTQRLANFVGEQRRATLVVMDPAEIEVDTEPTDEQLEAYLEENRARFTTPEYRELTFVTVTIDDLLDEVEVDPALVRETYDEEIQRYTKKESRTVVQVLAAERGIVEQAATQIANGTDPSALAIEGAAVSDLGSIERDDLPESFETAIFALEQPGVSEPVQSQFGWHVFNISEVTPEAVTPFEEARAEIADRLRREQAVQQLPDFATALDDQLGGGDTLEQAATTLNLDLHSVEQVDIGGADPNREPIAVLEDWRPLLTAAFEAPVGETSLLEETDDGRYYVYRVDGITEPKPELLADVRNEAVIGWETEQQIEQARAKAEDLRERLSQDPSRLDQLDEPGVDVREVGPLLRADSGAAGGLQPAGVATLFDTEPGAIAEGLVQVNGRPAVMVVDGDVEQDPEAAEAIEQQLSDALGSDLLSQLQAALQIEHPIQVDRALIDQMFAYDQEG